MSEAALQLIETQEVESKALAIPEQAKAIKIVDAVTYVQAGETLKVIKGIRKEIDATFDPIIEAAHQAHKIAIDKKKKADAPLVEAENYLKPAIFAYAVEQERKRKAEDGRLWKIARKEEEDRRMAEALSAEAEGNHEEAEEIIQAPVYVPPVVVEKQTPTVSGVSMVTTWKFRIVDELKVPRGYLKVDEIKIGGVVRAMKGATSISGVEAYPETGVRSGSR
jgi:hypothetical protein